jgi:hypothetical protein
MKSALVALVATFALLLTTGPADACWGRRGGYYSSGYAPYYTGYSTGYYGGYGPYSLNRGYGYGGWGFGGYGYGGWGNGFPYRGGYWGW